MEKAMFDYEKLLYDSLLVNEHANALNHTFKHKHLWVKKANDSMACDLFLSISCISSKDGSFHLAMASYILNLIALLIVTIMWI
jgi:hypothetical protein